MIARLLVAIVALATVGCAPAPAPESDPEPAAQCDAGKAQSLIGRQGSAELVSEAKRLSGAGTVRTLKPGQIVTMEFRADRLTIQVDEQTRVVAIRCG